MKKDIGDVAVAGKEAAIDGRMSPPAAETQAAGYNRAERGLASSMGRLAALPRGCCQGTNAQERELPWVRPEGGMPDQVGHDAFRSGITRSDRA